MIIPLDWKNKYWQQNNIGFKVLGKLPKVYPPIKAETKCFEKVDKTHTRWGFFQRDNFKERGIYGLLPGISKEIKFNTFDLSWNQVKHFTNAFIEIADKYNLI